MEIWIFPFVIMGMFLMLASSCEKEESSKGELEFRTIIPSSSGKNSIYLKSATNPPLVGDTTVTILKGVKACIGDIWVSQGEVKAGQPDNLEWIRLTDVTNTQLLTFENYSFPPKEVPVGEYRSIKISLKNIFYWQTELSTNSSVTYELLQTMGSSFDPCNKNDESWTKTNYFSTDGNHKLSDGGLFELVAPNEKVGGFTVEAGKTAIVNWRWLMRGCTFKLLDKNRNRIFDCGIDDIDMTCSPEIENMFDFVVEYD